MDIKEIKGADAYSFISNFDFIRDAGTEGEKKAAEIITSLVSDIGAEAVSEPFEFSMGVSDCGVLTACGKQFRVTTCGFTPDTPGEGINAPLVYIESGDSISLKKADGAVVMINGFVNRDTMMALKEAGAIGFLSVVGAPTDDENERIPIQRQIRLKENESSIYGAAIHFLDAAYLIDNGAFEGIDCNLKLSQHIENRKSQNLHVSLKGKSDSDETVLMCAHYDSVPMGPGAYDNMAGCAIVYNLLKYFSEHQPEHNMEFVFFGAEEKGLIGSRAFVAQHADELGKYRIAMNVDLAGQAVGSTVLGVTGDKSICGFYEKCVQECGLYGNVKHAVWSSDSNSFAAAGVPATTLDRDGFGMHTKYDTLILISSWSLERDSRLYGYIADRIDKMNELEYTRSVPDDFVKALNR